jgi:hypothetical protein
VGQDDQAHPYGDYEHRQENDEPGLQDVAPSGGAGSWRPGAADAGTTRAARTGGEEGRVGRRVGDPEGREIPQGVVQVGEGLGRHGFGDAFGEVVEVETTGGRVTSELVDGTGSVSVGNPHGIRSVGPPAGGERAVTGGHGPSGVTHRPHQRSVNC